MAEQERFYEKVVDRTPYGACYAIAIVALVFFVAVSMGIWKTGRAIRQSGIFDWMKDKGTATAQDSASQADKIIQDAKQSAAESAASAAQSALDSAKTQANQAAQDEINKQKTDLESAAKDTIKSVISPSPSPR